MVTARRSVNSRVRAEEHEEVDAPRSKRQKGGETSQAEGDSTEEEGAVAMMIEPDPALKAAQVDASMAPEGSAGTPDVQHEGAGLMVEELGEAEGVSDDPFRPSDNYGDMDIAGQRLLVRSYSEEQAAAHASLKLGSSLKVADTPALPAAAPASEAKASAAVLDLKSLSYAELHKLLGDCSGGHPDFLIAVVRRMRALREAGLLHGGPAARNLGDAPCDSGVEDAAALVEQMRAFLHHHMQQHAVAVGDESDAPRGPLCEPQQQQPAMQQQPQQPQQQLVPVDPKGWATWPVNVIEILTRENIQLRISDAEPEPPRSKRKAGGKGYSKAFCAGKGDTCMRLACGGSTLCFDCGGKEQCWVVGCTKGTQDRGNTRLLPVCPLHCSQVFEAVTKCRKCFTRAPGCSWTEYRTAFEAASEVDRQGMAEGMWAKQ